MKQLTKYTNSSCSSTSEKQPNQRMGTRPKQSLISSNKTSRWLINTSKKAQHCSLVEKCKSKPQWDHHTPIRMVIVRKSANSKCWRECGENGNVVCWWECKLITVWQFLKKLGMKLPYDPTVPLLGIYPEKTIIEKDNMYPSVHCSTVYNSLDIEVT